jgi:cold shock CspA family protein
MTSTGVVKMVNVDRGFGFLKLDPDPADPERELEIFFHKTSCSAADSFFRLEPGSKISCRVGKSNSGRHAGKLVGLDVILLADDEPTDAAAAEQEQAQ